VKLSLVTLAFAVVSCTHAPAPVADAGPTPRADTVQACANLAALGCAEGVDASCVSTFDRIVSARLILIDPSCLAAARSKADARACGGVECR